MKKLPFLAVFALSFFLTGCLDVMEEIHLNRDGSGKYAVTIDMSKLFSDDFMKEMIKSSLQEEGSLSLGEDGFPEMDTIIYFENLPEDQKGKRPEFWNKVRSNIVMSEEKGQFRTVILLDFDSMEDIAYLFDNLDAISEGSGQLASPTMGGVLPTGVAYAVAKNVLTRKSRKVESDTVGEELEMMKMFLGGASYRTVYHLPGKVVKANIPGAKVDNNTVTVEVDLLDVWEGNASLDGTIKYK
jgi:hypothetical protein